MYRRWMTAWAAAALSCALLAGCASPPEVPPPPGAAQVPPPAVKQGDYWEYAVRDAYTGLPRGVYRYTVSSADAQRIVVDVTRDGERVDTHLYTPEWGGLEHPLRNLQRFRFTPPYPAYAFPLYPGRSWHSVVSSTDPVTQRSYRTHVYANVGGWRRIRCPQENSTRSRFAAPFTPAMRSSSNCRKRSSRRTGTRRRLVSSLRAKAPRAISTPRAAAADADASFECEATGSSRSSSAIRQSSPRRLT